MCVGNYKCRTPLGSSKTVGLPCRVNCCTILTTWWRYPHPHPHHHGEGRERGRGEVNLFPIEVLTLRLRSADLWFGRPWEYDLLIFYVSGRLWGLQFLTTLNQAKNGGGSAKARTSRGRGRWEALGSSTVSILRVWEALGM